ncbi:hypothetical protein KCP73_19830 [Salmonella enterica subsp. enterica]|nr:hypothetical protein KCP73_19830 [Salmonella enterica subsp. enterica]
MSVCAPCWRRCGRWRRICCWRLIRGRRRAERRRTKHYAQAKIWPLPVFSQRLAAWRATTRCLYTIAERTKRRAAPLSPRHMRKMMLTDLLFMALRYSGV